MVADCSKGRDVDAVVGGPDVTRTAAARLAPSHVPTSNAITFAVLVTGRAEALADAQATAGDK